MFGGCSWTTLGRVPGLVMMRDWVIWGAPGLGDRKTGFFRVSVGKLELLHKEVWEIWASPRVRLGYFGFPRTRGGKSGVLQQQWGVGFELGSLGPKWGPVNLCDYLI